MIRAEIGCGTGREPRSGTPTTRPRPKPPARSPDEVPWPKPAPVPPWCWRRRGSTCGGRRCAPSGWPRRCASATAGSRGCSTGITTTSGSSPACPHPSRRPEGRGGGSRPGARLRPRRGGGAVHGLLCRGDGSGTVAVDRYLRETCTAPGEAFGANGGRRALVVRAEAAVLPADTARSLGPVVDELVTNLFRHAFAADGPGRSGSSSAATRAAGSG